MYLQQVKEKFVEGVSQSALSPHDLAQNEIAVNKQDEMQIKKENTDPLHPWKCLLFLLCCAAVLYLSCFILATSPKLHHTCGI